jgi:hypothetical protein
MKTFRKKTYRYPLIVNLDDAMQAWFTQRPHINKSAFVREALSAFMEISG